MFQGPQGSRHTAGEELPGESEPGGVSASPGQCEYLTVLPPQYSSSRLVSHLLNRVWPIVLLYNCCWYKLLYICLLIQTTEGPTERIGSHKCKVYSAFLPSFDGWYPVSGTTEDN